MPEGHQPLLDVAAALADGTPVDWDSAGHALTTDEDRRLLTELRFIADVARGTSSDSPDGLSTAAPRPSSSGRPAASQESWGPLTIIEHVGRGTYGDVYRAWDSRLDREVALKIVRRNRDDQAHASTVIQEGRLLARVRHPNVVTVYGAERVNGQVGVWMEFVHGKTLEGELREQGPFDVDRVIRIGIELAGALSTVHRAGLIHADVKAQNVLCDRDGRLVLTDFGSGVELDDTLDGVTGELAGTPLCVAPEVLAGQPASPRSDLYSLAVLLYHLLTGTYPVRGRSLKEVREAHAAGTRVPLESARPDVRHDLVRIINRALAPEVAARHETVDKLHSELTGLRPTGGEAHNETSKPSGARRPQWLSVVLLLLLLAAVVLTSSMLYQRSAWSTSFVIPGRSAGPWPTVVPEAYELYLRGSAAAERGGDGAKLAFQLFEQAIALDPAFAQPHAAIALIALDQLATLALPAGQRYERAKAAATLSLALAPQLPEAHLAAAKVKSAVYDWSGAAHEYRRAIELAPSHSLVRLAYAQWLSIHGRFPEAIVEADRAVALDPLSVRSHYTAGLVRRFARQCADALPRLETALQLDPQYGPAFHEIGQCHQMAGRHDLAIQAYRRGAQQPGNLGHALAAAGQTAEARTLLAQLIERHGESGSGSSAIAMIYIGLGEYEAALDWLERSSTGFTPTFKVAAVWDPLRSHPRFAEILRKRGLAPE